MINLKTVVFYWLQSSDRKSFKFGTGAIHTAFLEFIFNKETSFDY